MTPEQFRKSALAIQDAVESEHMAHPDFRINGRIFASLSATRKVVGMVRLTPEQQAAFCDSHPDVFQPCQGAWGRSGCTSVNFPAARVAVVRSALHLAAGNVRSGSQTRPASTKLRKKRPNGK